KGGTVPQTGPRRPRRRKGRSNCIPGSRRRCRFRDLAGPGREALLPGGNQIGESGLARDAPLGVGALRPGQNAECVFGRNELVLGEAVMIRAVAHCSRQVLSLIIARLIQLFIVPSGTLIRAASSS